MSLLRSSWWLAPAALVLTIGCVSSNDEGSCEAGNERCQCFGNGTCNAGLTCLSNHCVDVDGAEDGGSSSLAADDAASNAAAARDADTEGTSNESSSASDDTTDDTANPNETLDASVISPSDDPVNSDVGANPDDSESDDATDDDVDTDDATDETDETDTVTDDTTDETVTVTDDTTDPTDDTTDDRGAGGAGGVDPIGEGGAAGTSGNTTPDALPTFHSKLLSPPPVVNTDTVEYDGFGQALAVSGNLLVIGSNDDELGNGAGAAYAYVLQNGKWELEAKILPQFADGELDGQANAFFGTSLVLDGSRLVVGATGSDSFVGAAYAYERVGTTWEPRGRLVATDPSGAEARQAASRFGATLALSGDTLVVGSPRAQNDEGTDGIAYVFRETGGSWAIEANLTAQLPDGTPDGSIGTDYATAVSIAGDTIAVGDYAVDSDVFNTGCVYTYVRSGNTWSPQAKLFARTLGGDVVAVQNQNFGIRTHLTPNLLFVTTEEDYAGNSRVGAVRVFERSGNNWAPRAIIYPQLADGSFDGQASGEFGVVAYADGMLAVGARGDATRGDDSGAVYFYQQSGDDWLPRGKLLAHTTVGLDGSAGDAFGDQVALHDGVLVIGARGDDEVRSDSGSVFVFSMP